MLKCLQIIKAKIKLCTLVTLLTVDDLVDDLESVNSWEDVSEVDFCDRLNLVDVK